MQNLPPEGFEAVGKLSGNDHFVEPDFARALGNGPQVEAIKQAMNKVVERLLEGAPPGLVEDVKRGIGLDPEPEQNSKFKVGDRVGIVRESERRRRTSVYANEPTMVGAYGKVVYIAGCMSSCVIPREEGGGECRVFYVEPLGGLTDEAQEYWINEHDQELLCYVTELEHVD